MMYNVMYMVIFFSLYTVYHIDNNTLLGFVDT